MEIAVLVLLMSDRPEPYVIVGIKSVLESFLENLTRECATPHPWGLKRPTVKAHSISSDLMPHQKAVQALLFGDPINQFVINGELVEA